MSVRDGGREGGRVGGMEGDTVADRSNQEGPQYGVVVPLVSGHERSISSWQSRLRQLTPAWTSERNRNTNGTL